MTRDSGHARSERVDVVIIGSGAGGGTMARALASTGRRILVLERGGHFPRHADNWDPGVVWVEQRYRAKERWLTGSGDFQPNTHYGVGGNTKFWGSVLYRLRAEDFEAVGRAHGEAFSEIRPASTAVVIKELVDPRWLVEIEAEAVLTCEA